MKTIIAGTDFSASSLNASMYAAMMAGKLKCKLVLINLFDIPVVHSNSGLFFISFDAQKQRSQDKMEKFMAKIRTVYPKVNMSSLLVTGSLRKEIEDFIVAHHVEAVVLGLGTKTKLSRYIYGSNSTDIAGRVKCPVIIVPENYKKHSLKNLLLCVDNAEELRNSNLHDIEHFIELSKVKLKLLHVRTEEEVFDPVGQAAVIRGKKHKIDIVKAKDIETGIVRYCKKSKAEMVAIISKPHSVFYSLFAETHTKKVAFASKVPVIAIHN